jgi:hypothetical protein
MSEMPYMRTKKFYTSYINSNLIIQKLNKKLLLLFYGVTGSYSGAGIA